MLRIALPLLALASVASCRAEVGTTRLESVFIQPQQVHLSIAGDGRSFVVTWSTEQSLKRHCRGGGGFVEYGVAPFRLIKMSAAEESEFVDGGAEGRKRYVHRATMDELEPSTTYYYRVGCKITLSDLYFFKSLPAPDDVSWSPSVALFGDMGNENAMSLARLQNETMSGMYDVVLHVGDFAYDLDTQNGDVGDEFMRQIEPIAAYLPYMTCPGNHEEKYNFSHYRSRFSMPNESPGDMFYSFNLGPVHFISLSTEYYYFMNYGFHHIVRQYNWLVHDLEEATKPENRKLRPWIVLFGHRPMYCTGRDKDDCSSWKTKTRVGVEVLFRKFIYGLEDVLKNYSVDVAVWAHEHYYERFWPLYNFRVYNGSLSEPYTNAGAPIHIISGSAGCDEEKEPFKPNPPYYSAFRNSDYGFTRLKAHNATHLEFSQISDEKDGAVVDHFFVIKDVK